MSLLRAARRFQRATWLAVLLHATTLGIASLEHHDLACHRTTPQHCTSCVASQPGTNLHGFTVPGIDKPADAGRAISFLRLADGVVLPARSTGRSPPSLA